MDSILHVDNVVFLGDTHYLNIASLLESFLGKTNNQLIVHVGDIACGFYPERVDDVSLKEIYDFLVKYNNYLIIARGNHDFYEFFHDYHWANRKYGDRICFAEDYQVFNINHLKYQIIGGAISIDRKGRTPTIDWWYQEAFNLEESKCQNVDVLVTHSAPSFCHPVKFTDIVYGWMGRDLHLKSELIQEREDIAKAFHICKPKLHVYGHFHNYGNYEVINNCIHKQLGINEFWDLPPSIKP